MKFGALAIATGALALATQPAAAQDKPAKELSFAIAGEDYVMPVPGGFCLLTGMEKSLMEQFGKADTANVTPVDVHRCGTFGTDYVQIKSPIGIPSLPIPREQFIPLLGEELKKQHLIDQGFEAGRKNVDAMTGGEIDMQVDRIGYVGSDEQCAYISGAVQVAAGENKPHKVLVGSCGTIVGTRHLFVHSYAREDANIPIEQLMARSKAVALTIRRK